jgi:hypothetical protein
MLSRGVSFLRNGPQTGLDPPWRLPYSPASQVTGGASSLHSGARRSQESNNCQPRGRSCTGSACASADHEALPPARMRADASKHCGKLYCRLHRKRFDRAWEASNRSRKSSASFAPLGPDLSGGLFFLRLMMSAGHKRRWLIRRCPVVRRTACHHPSSARSPANRSAP